ncbi:MAG: MerR family transcriptional regulator [Oscillospiraceae bacterium]|nr:MerR family transcriptional regulator [Oscillospiraceae bacterium]
MKTVKEVSDLTGISVRTLHYYDEIGLFKPTEVSDAGYRLYDNEALSKLQQILIFRELDLPLADIRIIMDHPDVDYTSILEKQRELLKLKRERLDRIISSIDNMLKGDQNMDFTVFDETEIKTMFADMLANMNEEQKQIFIDHYGSLEAWEEHMLKRASDEDVQKNYAKVIEWYGGKEAAMASVKESRGSEIITAYQKRIGEIQRKIAGMRGTDVNDFAVRQLMGEYDFVAKQLYQIEDPKLMMLDIARGYRENREMREGFDSVYGEGAAEYVGEAIMAFYR